MSKVLWALLLSMLCTAQYIKSRKRVNIIWVTGHMIRVVCCQFVGQYAAWQVGQYDDTSMYMQSYLQMSKL